MLQVQLSIFLFLYSFLEHDIFFLNCSILLYNLGYLLCTTHITIVFFAIATVFSDTFISRKGKNVLEASFIIQYPFSDAIAFISSQMVDLKSLVNDHDIKEYCISSYFNWLPTTISAGRSALATSFKSSISVSVLSDWHNLHQYLQLHNTRFVVPYYFLPPILLFYQREFLDNNPTILLFFLYLLYRKSLYLPFQSI